MAPLNTYFKFVAAIIALLIISPSMYAQLDNDQCSNAAPFPDLTSSTQTCVDGTNIEAIGELPYINQGYCSAGEDAPAPAADVWYQFTAVSNILDIQITSGMSLITVSMYEGDCNGLIGRDCATDDDGDGILNITIAPTNPGTIYFLQVSGGDTDDQDDFELCLTNYAETEDEICILGQSLSVNPPPTFGSYTPGQFVEFCLTVGGYTEDASDWFHGLVPVFGDGWDQTSIFYTLPESCSGDGGFWEWYEEVQGQSDIGIVIGPQGPGWFYERPQPATPIDDNPGNNWGDEVPLDLECSWEFCITIATVASCPPGTDGDDLSVTFLNFSDSETGVWFNTEEPTICPEDPEFTFKALLTCCAPAELEGDNPTCASPNGGAILAVGEGSGPFTFAWSNGFTEEEVNFSNAEDLAEGTYEVTVTDANACETVSSFTLIEEEGGTTLDIAIDVLSCGNCAATEENPVVVNVISASTGAIAAELSISECPGIATICLPDIDDFNLVLGDDVIENAVVAGALSSSDPFVFVLGLPSEAGEMLQDEKVLCPGESTDMVTTGNVVEEGSIGIYALHTSITDPPGDILAVNAEAGDFSLVDANAYTTYYVSYLVGPDLDGDGAPDLDNDCTDVALGPPVVFLAPAEFVIGESCDWDTGEFYTSIALTGGYPQYAPSVPYSITGDVLTDYYYGTEASVVAFPEGTTTSYAYIANETCGGTMFSKEFYCEKTPVELLSFEGEVQTDGNLLKWITATETDNDYFTLARSTDGINFTHIATLTGAGNSLTTTAYNHLDKDAPAGLSYYRLSQTDYNGTTTAAEVITLLRGENDFTIISVHPSPVRNIANIKYTSPSNSDMQLRIYNVTGQLVLNNTIETVAGTNTLNVDLSKFAAGMYLLNISNGEQSINTKLVKN